MQRATFDSSRMSQIMRNQWNDRIEFDTDFWMTGWTDSAVEWARSGARDFQALVEGVDPNSARSWHALEFGCGTARMTLFAARFFAQVAAVDVSDVAVRFARERLKTMQNVTVRCCDGIHLAEHQDESCDCVYSYAVLSHFDYSVTAAALSEMVRILRIGGTMLFQIYVGNYEKIPDTADTLTIRGYDFADLANALEALGCDGTILRTCILPSGGIVDQVLRPVIVQTRRSSTSAQPDLDKIRCILQGSRCQPVEIALEQAMLYDRLQRLIKREEWNSARSTAEYLLANEDRAGKIAELEFAVELLRSMAWHGRHVPRDNSVATE